MKNLQGYKAFFSIIDVTKENQLQAWIDDVGKKEGRIDICIPNAAYFGFGSVEQAETEVWKETLNTNILGYSNAVKFATPYLKKGINGGAIVTIGSVQSYKATKSFLPYNASKGAIINMTKCFALDLGEYKIRANCVCPGLIETPITSVHAEKLGTTRENLIQKHIQKQMIKRGGTTLDVAYAVLFLASDEASFITGTALLVDGGLTGQ